MFDTANLESIVTSASFTVDNGEVPVTIANAPGSARDERKGAVEEREITAHDVRSIADQFDMDREGFAFMNCTSEMKDFFDEEQVKSVYYPEIENLVAGVTGASKVVVFDHTIRVADEAKREEMELRPPVRAMHNDFTIRSAEQRVRDLLPADEAEARLKKRFGSVNVWRPLRGPVENLPLAICGWDSLADADMIVSERRYEDRIGGILSTAYNSDQRWVYFSQMQRHEVVLLKCYDSLTDGTARWTAHGTFDLPGAATDSAPRESIEIRTMMFWD
ncbi:MAG: methyltransferase [Rhodospirillaceae bacterium]|jgi:hypothetical protein|nr:methyltransferase [Rhodospirillaceae bacterium]MBT4674245.1 methyltransferase [Rhodospirillaceae bacterium]MBT6290952.1 methyltransferase [Rhodospirillaceae bacterium]MBT6858861.1 methyltransferase [Rhodospirillaceae bacterium]MBT7032148.1 methyltransferase [Rhodospirillaceae bacterium]